MYPGVINGIVEQLVLECKVPSGCNFGVEIYNLLMRLGMNIDRIWWMSGQGPKWTIMYIPEQIKCLEEKGVLE